MRRLVFIALFACVLACSGGPPPDGPTLVTTDHGQVQGSVADGVRLWLGIPFAAPPTGPNRFLPPKPAAPWTLPIIANKPGAECPQLSFASPPALTCRIYHLPDGRVSPVPSRAQLERALS